MGKALDHIREVNFYGADMPDEVVLGFMNLDISGQEEFEYAYDMLRADTPERCMNCPMLGVFAAAVVKEGGTHLNDVIDERRGYEAMCESGSRVVVDDIGIEHECGAVKEQNRLHK